MSTPEITPPQRREHADPREGRHPVPRFVLALVAAMTLTGIVYIASSPIESPSAWGDERERGELSAGGAPAGTAVDGAALYAARCASCHQADGRGLPGVFPPLAGSEWVSGADATMVAIVLQGVNGELRVGGQAFNGAMPAFKTQLDDTQAAAVISHVRQRFGAAGAVPPARVADVRKALAGRAAPFNGQRDLETWR